jgi:excisionase family DNA binding protein
VFDQKFIDELARALAPRVAELLVPKLSNKIAPAYLDLDQAAEYLGTTPDGVRGMLRAKHFPVRKIGARVRIAVKDINRVMDDNVQYLDRDQTFTGNEIADWIE